MQESVQIVTIVLIGTLLFLVLVAFVIASLFFYQRAQHRHYQEVAVLRNTYEQELLKANLEIKEQTLKAVAQEIHDNIGQILSLVKLNLNTMDTGNEMLAKTKLKNARDQVSKAIADLRDLSKVLNADHVMAQELPASIRHEVEQLQKTGTIKASFDVRGEERPLPPQQRLIVFRIFQEAMNNVIKHANASLAETVLAYDQSGLTISLRDDGQGFVADATQKKMNGTGLRNMQNRASLIGSRFAVESSPGLGTLVQIQIPL